MGPDSDTGVFPGGDDSIDTGQTVPPSSSEPDADPPIGRHDLGVLAPPNFPGVMSGDCSGPEATPLVVDPVPMQDPILSTVKLPDLDDNAAGDLAVLFAPMASSPPMPAEVGLWPDPSGDALGAAGASPSRDFGAPAEVANQSLIPPAATPGPRAVIDPQFWLATPAGVPVDEVTDGAGHEVGSGESGSGTDEQAVMAADAPIVGSLDRSVGDRPPQLNWRQPFDWTGGPTPVKLRRPGQLGTVRWPPEPPGPAVFAGRRLPRRQTPTSRSWPFTYLTKWSGASSGYPSPVQLRCRSARLRC